MSVCRYVHTNSSALGRQRSHVLWKLQYQEATSCLMWVLGNKLPLEEEYVLNLSIPK